METLGQPMNAAEVGMLAGGIALLLVLLGLLV